MAALFLGFPVAGYLLHLSFPTAGSLASQGPAHYCGADNDHISDDAHDRHGFYNYMKKAGYNVYSITSATKYNLIPHFEINGR